MDKAGTVRLIELCDRNAAIIQDALDELAIWDHLRTAKERANCVAAAVGVFQGLYWGERLPGVCVANAWATCAWAKLLLVHHGGLSFDQARREISISLENALDKTLDNRQAAKRGAAL